MGFGIVAEDVGLTLVQALGMSATVFASASQMVALEAWTDPPALLSLALLAITINLRHIVMGAAIHPWFARLPLWQSHLGLALMTDANWALTMAEHRKGERDAAVLVGSGLVLWVSWVAGTGAGYLMGTVIGDPRTYGMDVLVPAFFALSLIPLWTGLGTLVPWIIAGAVAYGVSLLAPGTWHVIAGGLAGAMLAAWLEDRKGARGDQDA